MADALGTNLMPAGRRLNRRPLILLCIVVCIAGAAVAFVCGAFANILYWPSLKHNPDAATQAARASLSRIVTWWNPATGLLAGIIWCIVMIRRARQQGPTRLGAGGAVVGLMVGSLSAVLVHLGLGWGAGKLSVEGIMIGLVCGVIAGAILGGICGVLCRAAVKRASGDASPPSGVSE
jgi:hypothetical protein